MRLPLFTSLFFFLGTAILFAITPGKEFEHYKKAYPEENQVYKKIQHHYTISVKADKLEMNRSVQEERILLDKRYNVPISSSIQYSGFIELKSIKAGTQVPKSLYYKEQEVEEFNEKDVLDGSIFYNDQKEVSFKFPAITPGAKTYINYEQEILDPHFMPGFYPIEGAPIEKAELSIEHDASVDIGYFIYNPYNRKIDFERTEKDGKVYLNWKMDSIKGLETEPGMPGARSIVAQIIPFVKSFTTEKGEEINVSGTIDNLYDWYWDFVQQVDTEPDESLKIISDSLKNLPSVQSDLDMVRAVYQWTQSNVKYVAFEDGLGGFIPRDPKLICKRRFGDCKDMTSIMKSLLSIAGIESHWTWIGTRDIPYSYNQLATPSVDNHMILTYFDEEEPYFLDATASLSAFGLPSSFIQGKEALIAIDSKNYKIITVPVIKPETNSVIDSISFDIEGKSVVGTGKVYIDGYPKQKVLRNLLSKNEDEVKRYFERYLQKGNNSFVILNYSVSNEKELDKPLKVSYSFKIDRIVQKLNDETFINLNFDPIYANSDYEEDRKYPISADFRPYFKNHFKLKLDENYLASFVPENLSYKTDKVSALIEYENRTGALIYKAEIKPDFLELPAEELEQWNSMVKALKSAYNETVVLKKKE